MAAVNRTVRRRRKGGKGPARRSKKMGRTEAEGKGGLWLESSRDRMGSARQVATLRTEMEEDARLAGGG
jgi:hypothetical protein